MAKEHTHWRTGRSTLENSRAACTTAKELSHHLLDATCMVSFEMANSIERVERMCFLTAQRKLGLGTVTGPNVAGQLRGRMGGNTKAIGRSSRAQANSLTAREP